MSGQGNLVAHRGFSKVAQENLVSKSGELHKTENQKKSHRMLSRMKSSSPIDTLCSMESIN